MNLHFKKKYFFFAFLLLILKDNRVYAQTDTSRTLLDLSIEELMQINIVTASGKKESMIDVAATMVIITNDDIKKRGYTDLTEIITDLPGFDVIDPNGRGGVVAYQRGYRTPITQRTLLMINGIIDNDLWSQEALLGKHYPIGNIERVEVLYGPTSALYGANAFLGIINIITKNGSDLDEDGQQIFVSSQYGSFNTKNIELASIGKKDNFSYSFSGKIYKSDEADLSDKWGFLSNDKYNDTTTWGPVLQHEHHNVNYGKYYSASDDYGIIGDIAFKGTRLGIINWVNKEGYGSWYTADRSQNNASWRKSSFQIYLENKTQLDKFSISSLLLHRRNRVSGDWAEAEPDWHPGMGDSSYISITEWNCLSSSWLFKEDVDYVINDNITVQAGIKYERKDLTKAYDIPGYWNAFSSSVPSTDPGPHGYGAGIGYSSDSVYNIVEGPHTEMPSENLLFTDDMGEYLQVIAEIKKIRFNGGVRYDNNSIYGSNSNIRASAIYKFNKTTALKIIYGEAYQEPSPKQLFGGWNGRQANENLKPEKARNLEMEGMYANGPLSLETSLFYSQYQNVIKEEAENAGERTIYGLELRSLWSFKNVIPNTPKITAYLFYTYTNAISSIHYYHVSGNWEDGETILGDIAPHKINVGIDLPVTKSLNLNLRGNYVSKRLVYTRNALRARDYYIDDYFTLDGTVSYRFKIVSLSVKVKNITDSQYFHPGLEQADSGDNFSQRSLGYRNSLLPQKGRTYFITLNFYL